VKRPSADQAWETILERRGSPKSARDAGLLTVRCAAAEHEVGTLHKTDQGRLWVPVWRNETTHMFGTDQRRGPIAVPEWVEAGGMVGGRCRCRRAYNLPAALLEQEIQRGRRVVTVATVDRGDGVLHSVLASRTKPA